MYLQRLRLYPLPVLIVESLLRNLTDIDLRVEVRGESVMMIASIAIDNVEIMDLVEVMLGSIGCIDATDTWVEAATEDSSQTCLLETILIGPLPGIFEMCLVLRLVISRIKVVAATGKTGIHDCQVLIRQSEVNHEFRLVVVEEGLQLFHIVSIYLSGLDVHLVASLVDVIHDFVTLRLSATSDHKVRKHVCVLCYLERSHCCDAPGANHQYFCHILIIQFDYLQSTIYLQFNSSERIPRAAMSE